MTAPRPAEESSVFGDAYSGKMVLVTGHTGFKGSWLNEWLLLLGARVVGYSLDPPTDPSHFELLRTTERLHDDIRADVRDLDTLEAAIERHQPDFIFHLAAQAIVRQGVTDPHGTFDTNVVGSLNVLEAVRRCGRDCVVIMVTTDKVYENAEWVWSYRENDRLGGKDPYSASKACAEMVTSAYQRTFFAQGSDDDSATPAIDVATVRGGNVLGGGDWAADRIFPDCIRCLSADAPINVRNPRSTRPWQHVLELSGGYLHLAAAIATARGAGDGRRLAELCTPFNFGPGIESNRSVKDLVTEILKHWPGSWRSDTDGRTHHEAGRLCLSIDKAVHTLGWAPTWTFEETIRQTVEWYRAHATGGTDTGTVRELTTRQIRAFTFRLESTLVSSGGSHPTGPDPAS